MSRIALERFRSAAVVPVLAGLVIFIAASGIASASYKSECNQSYIKNSFNQIEKSDDEIARLQKVLIDNKFLRGDTSGRLDDKTDKAFHKFCLQLGKQGKFVPHAHKFGLSPDMANFLIDELNALPPVEPGDDPDPPAPKPPAPDPNSNAGQQPKAAKDCDVNTGVEDLGDDNIRRAQQQLTAAGYGTGGIDGIPGHATKLAFEHLCQQFSIAGTKDEVTANLVNFLDNTDVITKEYPGWLPILQTRSFLSWLQQNHPDDLQTLNDASLIGDDGAPSSDWIDQVRLALSRYSGKLPKLVDLDLDTINITGDGCGCSQQFTRQVYGFYPYLGSKKESEDEDAQAEKIDFSALDRIGFFAFGLDENGKPGRSASEENVARLLGTAHRHRVKVDFVFYLSDWANWNGNEPEQAVQSINSRIKPESNMGLEDLQNDLSSLLQGSWHPSADGVSLYFDKYADSDDGIKINTIVNTIADGLDAKPGFELSVVLGIDWPHIETRQIAALADMLVGDNARVDKLFINLAPDTSASKKQLRRVVEEAFYGEQRRTALRKIMPIIEAGGALLPPRSGRRDTQFADDLIYFEDNFAGVGLWWSAADAHDAEKSQIINRAIEAELLDTGESNILVKLAGRFESQLCQFACPNRWYFRIALDVLVAFWVLYGLCAIWNCRLREIFKSKTSYFFGIGAVTVLDLVIMTVCDPVWQALADTIVFGILMVIVAILLWRRVTRPMRSKLP